LQRIEGRKWLRSRGFDAALQYGAATTAVGFVAMSSVVSLTTVVSAALWLVGYTHIVATFTRLDVSSARDALARYVLPAVLVVFITGWTAGGVGVPALLSAYFYLHALHATQQSAWIADLYGKMPGERDRWSSALLYTVPLVGVLVRSAEGGTGELGMEARWLPVPSAAATVGVSLLFVVIFVWVITRLRRAWKEELSLGHTAHVTAHLTVFAFGYIMVDDVTVGWVAIEVWHGLQYLLVTWSQNVDRYGQGLDPEARLLSVLSQPGNRLVYGVVMLSFATVLYMAAVGPRMGASVAVGVTLALTAYVGLHLWQMFVDAMSWFRDTR